jgi:hypothetical protein
MTVIATRKRHIYRIVSYCEIGETLYKNWIEYCSVKHRDKNISHELRNKLVEHLQNCNECVQRMNNE